MKPNKHSLGDSQEICSWDRGTDKWHGTPRVFTQ